MSQGQVMKTSDLEKYAKSCYGNKWLDTGTYDSLAEASTFIEVIDEINVPAY